MSKSRFGRILVCLACVSMAVTPTMAANPVSAARIAATQVFDVSLSPDGKIGGQVVSAAGKAEADQQVVVTREGKLVAATQTNNEGHFTVAVPRAGVYGVAVADRAFTVRAWQAKAAPPKAHSGLLCVVSDTVRGQYNAPDTCATDCGPYGAGYGGAGLRSGCLRFLSNPVVLGLGIATAIALPIALDDDDDNGGGMGNGGAGEPAS